MIINKLINYEDKRIENFKNEDVKNTCHYVCSSINWMNIFLVFLLIVLCYVYFQNGA